GRSIQSLTVSPASTRREASVTVCSAPLTKTLPRSIAERAFDLEPSRSAAPSHLSSRAPASDSLTCQFLSLIIDKVTLFFVFCLFVTFVVNSLLRNSRQQATTELR